MWREAKAGMGNRGGVAGTITDATGIPFPDGHPFESNLTVPHSRIPSPPSPLLKQVAGG